MMIMPSDHYIAHPDQFAATVKAAAQWASKTDDLVTLGIRPSRPETGYGYLKTGELISPSGDSSEVRQVAAFVEKPNLEKATEFVKSGNYLWNGGMFLWRAEVILKAFDQFMPEMKQAWEKASGRVEAAYPHLTATSIDYGIMEKAKNVVTFPLECGWDDLGSWTSLENLAELLGARRGDNVITGGELLAIESARNIVDAPSRLVALLGVDDLIVVEQGDAILVAKKERAQDIRKVVEEVKKIRPELV
jgi:mannose-1-phosphate guanylyltransferase